MPKQITYINPPKVCDDCGKPFGKVMYDAKSAWGPWGNFCQACFDRECLGLGTGLGQKYELNDSGDWVKTAG